MSNSPIFNQEFHLQAGGKIDTVKGNDVIQGNRTRWSITTKNIRKPAKEHTPELNKDYLMEHQMVSCFNPELVSR